MRKTLILIMSFMMIFCLSACSGENISVNISGGDLNLSAINLENYDKIEPGMTQFEVEALLGEGELSASISKDTSVFSWSGPGLTSISITFADGKVSSKAEIGLGGSDDLLAPEATPEPSPTETAENTPAEEPDLITKENFDKIETGMTLTEVEAILGTGEENVSGDTMISYLWSKDPLHGITVIFKDGLSVSKFQIGL